MLDLLQEEGLHIVRIGDEWVGNYQETDDQEEQKTKQISPETQRHSTPDDLLRKLLRGNPSYRISGGKSRTGVGLLLSDAGDMFPDPL
jgi:hypothetical protein